MGYVGAPYNFIDLNKKVFSKYEKFEDLPKHNKIYEDKLSGEIEYEIINETPLFIGDGSNKDNIEFFKNVNGEYAIPGSSIRGLIKTNVQVLGYGSVGQDIENKYMMYRCVAGSKYSPLKKFYTTILDVKPVSIPAGDKTKTISITKNVKAGYITKKGNDYVILQTKIDNIDTGKFGEMNYYSIREDYIEREKKKYGKKEYPFEYLWNDKECKLQHIGNFKKVGNHIIGTQNSKYKPDYFPISYELHDTRKITAIGKPNKYKYNGYLIMTGLMKEKKCIYVIPEVDYSKEEIAIDKKGENINILSFKTDFENRKNQLGENKNFFDLPKDGEIKPVFYINVDGRLYFGYTPYLRLFYKGSIFDGLNDNQKDTNILDYSKALFGFSDKDSKSSYKSRVYFKDVINVENKGFGTKTLVLSSPKPTSYLDYLVQENSKDIKTYNSLSCDNKNFQLRGIKQYWLKKDLDKCEESELQNINICKSFKYIKENSKFKGKIIFKNLDKDELGLLLWSLNLEENCKQNIGMAKPYGYGRIEINVNKVKIYNYKKMYDINNLDFNVMDDVDKKEYIDFYKEHISNWLGKSVSEMLRTDRIKDFITMKTKIMPNDKVKYMKLEDYSLKNREPLPTVESVLNSKIENKNEKFSNNNYYKNKIK